MKPLIIEQEVIGLDGKKREFTQALDLTTGNVVELRYKGIARDFQKSGYKLLESSQDAQSILDES